MKEPWKRFWEGIVEAKWLIILVIFIFIIALLINYYPFLYNLIKSTEEADATQEIGAWFSFLSGAAAASLTAIAWFKFSGFYDQNQANILLRIDERWGSLESIKARVIIHEIYLKVQKDNKKTISTLNNALGARETFIQLKIGEKIIEFGKEINKKNEFICLLNFLDFMETIGYIHHKGQVEVDELEALCGESLMFNYRIFKPYIEDKRKRHENKGFYAYFDNLYKNLKEKPKSKTS